MTAQLAIAIFGVGRWGIHLLRNFLAHPQVNVTAVVDPSAERLSAIADQFQLNSQVVLTTDPDTVLSLATIDAVVIATPATTHYWLIETALKQNKHVLAEKPLTLKAEESQALCALAKQQQRLLVIDHTYLFHPAVRTGQSVLQNGTLGQPRYGYATRSHLSPVRWDVDALWDLAIHDIAIFNAWLGDSPIQVQAEGQVWLQPDAGDATFFPNGLSDLVWVTLTYASGFQAKIHLCWCNPDKQRRLCVVGSEGTLIFDELASDMLTLQHGSFQAKDGLYHPINQNREVLPIPAAEPLRSVCDHFVDCILRSQPSQISPGEIGADLVRILNALTTSLNQGGQPVAVGDCGNW
ncbi:MAG: Gfo/Idh/MocA family protein [Thainema sp.]